MRILLTALHAVFLTMHLTLSEVQAQDTRISGRVLDGTDGVGLVSATVALWTAEAEELVAGTITGEDGEFEITDIPYGSYDLEVSFVGFEAQRVTVELSSAQSQVVLPDIRLYPDAQTLDEVRVEAEREYMEVAVDRMVYNTAEQLVSIGGSASNVLENIPSVEIDLDGNISLRGNQNVAVMINGKPSPMTGDALTSFLEGLPSDIVERVEVIPNPSARFEPEGLAGILNIVLQEDRDPGLTGGVSLTAGTQRNYNASANINYQTGRLGFFGSYGFRSGTRQNEGWRFRENRYDEPLSFIDQDNFSHSDRLSNTVNARFDYDLTRRNTISLSGILSHRTRDGHGETEYRLLDEHEDLTNHYIRGNHGDRTDLNMDVRLRFDHIIDRGSHELTAEISFDNEREEDVQHFEQEVVQVLSPDARLHDELETSLEDAREREWSVEIDYVRPFREEGQIEAGYHFDFETLDSESFAEVFDEAVGIWRPDIQRNNQFRYGEQIHAAYGIMGTSVGRFGLQAGVRAEHARTKFDLSDDSSAHRNRYVSLFPSVFLSYNISDARSIRASYSKRVRRPRTWQMNPFDNNRDPLFRRQGNPQLMPQYVHSLEASYVQFTQRTSLTLTPYFRRTVDVIRRIERVDEQGVTISTFENLDTSDSWGIEAVGRVELSDWMNAFTSLNVYRVVTDGSSVDTDLSNDAYGLSSRTNATFRIMPDLDLQLSFHYRAPLETERGRIAGRSSVDFALRQQLLGNRASLSLRARDVFDQRHSHILHDDALYFQESYSDWDARRISISFRYNFGSGSDGSRGGGSERGMDMGRDDEMD